MLRTIEVTVDPNGTITASEPVAVTSRRRAILTILDEDVPADRDLNTLALLSEPALARYWSSKAEDDAWAHLKDLPALDDDE